MAITFHSFTSLPLELRLKIWKFSLEPLIVILHNKSPYHNEKYLSYTTRLFLPSLLHINNESRAFVLPLYGNFSTIPNFKFTIDPGVLMKKVLRQDQDHYAGQNISYGFLFGRIATTILAKHGRYYYYEVMDGLDGAGYNTFIKLLAVTSITPNLIIYKKSDNWQEDEDDTSLQQLVERLGTDLLEDGRIPKELVPKFVLLDSGDDLRSVIGNECGWTCHGRGHFAD